jgi:hypothetical protein
VHLGELLALNGFLKRHILSGKVLLPEFCFFDGAALEFRREFRSELVLLRDQLVELRLFLSQRFFPRG